MSLSSSMRVWDRAGTGSAGRRAWAAVTVLLLSSEFEDAGGGGEELGEGFAIRSGPRLRSPALIVVEGQHEGQ